MKLKLGSITFTTFSKFSSLVYAATPFPGPPLAKVLELNFSNLISSFSYNQVSATPRTWHFPSSASMSMSMACFLKEHAFKNPISKSSVAKNDSFSNFSALSVSFLVSSRASSSTAIFSILKSPTIQRSSRHSFLPSL